MNAHVADGLLRAGNANCAGCGMTLGLRWFGEALAGTTPLLAIPPCCATVTSGLFPTTAYHAPGIATTFASSAAVGSGMSRVLRQNNEDQPVVCWTGDGGTYDIGMATLSAAAERNEDVIYVCYDNEIYGNTGGQRSSATPMGAKTTTSARGKVERKKDIMAIMAAHRVPYAASLSLAHHDDFVRKVKLALGLGGFRFLLMLSPCPAGWKCQPDESVALVRMAVGCGIYPVFEVFDGVRYRVNVRPDGTPLEDYLARQKRFKSEGLDVDFLQADVSARWTQLRALEEASPAEDEECATLDDVQTPAVAVSCEVRS
jgi:pyruvate ferredoxin oxidoreductase beta subunit/2-oxoisovalerate ferredoxin oxidoreductase beta subunit